MSQGKLRLRAASNACMLRSLTVNRPGTNGSYINWQMILTSRRMTLSLVRRKRLRRIAMNRATKLPQDTLPRAQNSEDRLGRFVRDPPNRGRPKVDCGRRVPALLKVNPVPEHDGAVEREARFRGRGEVPPRFLVRCSRS
jgi:hypothetical protein